MRFGIRTKRPRLSLICVGPGESRSAEAIGAAHSATSATAAIAQAIHARRRSLVPTIRVYGSGSGARRRTKSSARAAALLFDGPFRQRIGLQPLVRDRLATLHR